MLQRPCPYVGENTTEIFSIGKCGVSERMICIYDEVFAKRYRRKIINYDIITALQ